MIRSVEDIVVWNSKMREKKDFIGKLTLSMLCLMLVACGSTPVSKSHYTSVQTQIDDAQKINAADYAGGELQAAQNKLKEAHKADEDGNREKALRLLKEAGLHAQLAESRAMSVRSQKALDEINAGLATLQNELNR